VPAGNGDGGELRRSWAAGKGVLGLAEHGNHNGIEREGKGKGARGECELSRHPRGDYGQRLYSGS
jgi:hypothetical protein